MIKGLVLAALLLIGSVAQSSAQYMIRSYVPGVASGGTPAIDGTATGSTPGGASSVTATLTTTHSNDVIIVTGGGINTATAGNPMTVSGCGLTWTQYSFSNDTSDREVQLWYAIAVSPLSSCVISVGLTAFNWSYSGMTAMGISGANTTTPFDTNGSSHPTAFGTSSTPTVTGLSTSNAHDILIGGVVAAGSGPPSAGSGFTLLWGSAIGPVEAGEYQVVSATQSGISLTFGGLSGASSWAMLAAAVQ